VLYSPGVPRAGWIKPETDQRLSDHVALGVLTRTFPPALVDGYDNLNWPHFRGL